MCRIEDEELRRSKLLKQCQSYMMERHQLALANQVGRVAGRDVKKIDSGDSVVSRMKQSFQLSAHEDRLLESKVNSVKKIDAHLARKVQTPEGVLV